MNVYYNSSSNNSSKSVTQTHLYDLEILVYKTWVIDLGILFPAPERPNRTVLNMLDTLGTHQEHNWTTYFPSLGYANSCTPHESTNVAPCLEGDQNCLWFPLLNRWPKVTEKQDTKECKERPFDETSIREYKAK